MHPDTRSLIDDAIAQKGINGLNDLPWFDVARGEPTDETALCIWLENLLGRESPPTLTLDSEALCRLFTAGTFRLALTRVAVGALLERHQDAIDEFIRTRIDGATFSYTPELNRYLIDKVNRIIDNEVGNHLRLRHTEINEAVRLAVDAKLEKTIDAAVEVKLAKIKQRIIDTTGQ